MVIEPGRITLELLMDPVVYMALTYVVPLVISAIAAWWADQSADESMKTIAREKNPAITPEELNNIYDFEHIRYPILGGILAGIIVVWTSIFSFGIGLEEASVLGVFSGLTARWVLGKGASSFVSKNK